MKKSNIVIPTYNRPRYLKRLLQYYQSDAQNYTFIIADSSIPKNREKNTHVIKEFSDYDIISPQPYPTDMNMFYKLADALTYAQAKYCVICADDDFITPLGITQSVAFLQSHPEYSCAHGDYISFFPQKTPAGKSQFYWKPGYQYSSITSSNPEERLSYHLSHYEVATFYAVHPTSLIQLFFKEITNYTDTENDGQFGELLPSMLTLIYGKMKKLDGMLYCAREAIPTSAGRTSKKLANFVSDGTYDSKYSRFKSCLSTHLQQKSSLTRKQAERIIDKAWGHYTKHYHGFITPKLSYLMNKAPLSPQINEKMRRTYRKAIRKKTSSPHQDIWEVTETPPQTYGDEFTKITEITLSSDTR